MDSVKDQDDSNDSRHPESNLTLVKVGNPISSSIPIPTTDNPSAVTVASLAINTSCFSHPIIRIDFTGNIIIPATLPDVTLTFQVFRRFKNQIQLIAVGPPWVFARQLTFTTDDTDESVTLATKDIISFFISDPGFESSHCGATYTVVVTPSISRIPGTVTINNATLSAIVSGQSR